jgi:hypothetical protein
VFAALCQSAGSREKTRESPVCGGFAFHVLMTVDETGVLRVRSGNTTRDEAERNPLHPIRVIPAREVSGKRHRFSSFFQHSIRLGARHLRRPAGLAADFVL